MSDGIRSRLQKLENRETLISEQLNEVGKWLETNEMELDDLTEELRSVIGEGNRPTYLVDTWKETINKVPQFLSLTTEEAVKLLVEKGE